MVKKIQYLLVLAGAMALLAAFTIKKIKPSSIKIIVIDPGHGGKDPGCNGASHKEKDISLAVALKLGKLLEENLKDVKVIFTRTTDVFVELEDRAQIANKAKADLFISIHCNAAGKPVMIKDKKTGKKRPKLYKNKKGKYVVVEKPNPYPFGSETYVMGVKNEEGKMKVATRENSAILLEDDYEKKYGGFDPESEESYIIMSNYTSAYVIQSASLAMKIQEEYTKKAGRVDKGVHRQSIWVLWRTSMPSILTEIGYLTNPLEEQFLASEKGQEYLAKSIFRGLRRYKDEIEGNKKEYNDGLENQEPLENENIKAGNLPGQKPPEDEDEVEEKKLETKKDSVVVTQETELKNKEEVEKVNDGKFVDIELKKKDSTQTALIRADSIAAIKIKAEEDARMKADAAIANKAKMKWKLDSIAATKAEVEKYNNVTNKKSEILFKVQFATSDVELNLKQEKFKEIEQGEYYKESKTFKYTSGNYTSFKEAAQHQNKLREKGFKECFVIALKNGERINVLEAKKEVGQ